MKKFRVLVDMDGPLADFDTLFFERCVQNGYTLDCDITEQRHRFATDHIPDRRERELARQMVNTSGWFKDLPVTPGAQEGLELLDEFCDVWICTKPLEVNPTCRDDKAHWLGLNFGGRWVRRLIITPDKSLVQGDILLDDAPHITWLDKADWKPVIFPTPWNGEGSDWAGHARWYWSDPIENLLNI